MFGRATITLGIGPHSSYELKYGLDPWFPTIFDPCLNVILTSPRLSHPKCAFQIIQDETSCYYAVFNVPCIDREDELQAVLFVIQVRRINRLPYVLYGIRHQYQGC